MSRPSSHEAAHDPDSEGQQQVREQISNSTRINLRSASEYERGISRFQLRDLSGREHEDLTQNGKKWSRMPERPNCVLQDSRNCLDLAAIRQLSAHPLRFRGRHDLSSFLADEVYGVKASGCKA